MKNSKKLRAPDRKPDLFLYPPRNLRPCFIEGINKTEGEIGTGRELKGLYVRERELRDEDDAGETDGQKL